MLYIYDILTNIVNNIRETGSIISITFIEQSNRYYYYDIVIDDIQSLSVGDWINVTSSGAFNSENLEITSIIDNTISIRRLDEPTITTLGTWQANAPYLIIEKLLKASHELTIKDNNPIYSNQKFPLIHIVLNIEENRDSDYQYDSIANNVVVFIVKNTNYNEGATWKRDNIIKPYLIPVYENLINEIRNNRFIEKDRAKLIKHKYIEDTNFGSIATENNKYDKNKNVYNEVTDAIILRFDTLKIYKSVECLTLNV